jgi:protein-L-isoaspartate(D-aspartate) O-methyltransferase
VIRQVYSDSTFASVNARSEPAVIQQLFNSDRFHSERLSMVENQLRRRGIRDEGLLRAMEQVPRHEFIPEEFRDHSYEDRPIPIGEDQTISQPYIVAAMISALQVEPANIVLEVGTGTGYQAAILSCIAHHVFTIERHATLAQEAKRLFQRLGFSNITVALGDGSLGLPEHAPFDRIIVAAAAPSLPEPLVQQLRDPGRIVVPLGTADAQVLHLIRKEQRETFTRTLESCRFVPLVGAGGFPPRNF